MTQTLGLILLVSAALAGQATHKSVDGPFPYDVSVRTPDGKVQDLSHLKGKPAVVLFFSTWAPPADAQAKTLSAVADSLRAEHDVHVVGILFASVAATARYVKENKIAFPVFTGSSKLGADLDVSALPSLWLVSRSGTVTTVRFGPVTAETLRQDVVALKKRSTK